LFYKENVRFKGKYKVSIKQAVRETGKVPGVTLLEGITDVGLRKNRIGLFMATKQNNKMLRSIKTLSIIY
jgi:pseudouridine-5'-phosphate glycosidase